LCLKAQAFASTDVKALLRRSLESTIPALQANFRIVDSGFTS
jgi:hypothetical protein